MTKERELLERAAGIMRGYGMTEGIIREIDDLLKKDHQVIRVEAWTRHGTIMAEAPDMGGDDDCCNATLIIDSGINF